MTLEQIRDMLMWCAVINMGILLYWALFLLMARDWVYRVHSRWIKVTEERFDAIHYGGMTAFKITIFAFNIVPCIALYIVA